MAGSSSIATSKSPGPVKPWGGALKHEAGGLTWRYEGYAGMGMNLGATSGTSASMLDNPNEYRTQKFIPSWEPLAMDRNLPYTC